MSDTTKIQRADATWNPWNGSEPNIPSDTWERIRTVIEFEKPPTEHQMYEAVRLYNDPWFDGMLIGTKIDGNKIIRMSFADYWDGRPIDLTSPPT